MAELILPDDESELLALPHQQQQLNFWADIRLGGHIPGPYHKVPAWNRSARYVTPKYNAEVLGKPPLPPQRTRTILHDSKWIARHKDVKLKGPFGNDYEPIKKFAEGGFGSISLWKRKGAYSPEEPRSRIVVKDGNITSLINPTFLAESAVLHHEVDFQKEAIILLKLKKAAGSKHIVGIEWPNIVGANQVVPEVYMEFCEGGDLEMEIWRRFEANQPFAESEIWYLAECLVKALLVLDCGSEDGKVRDSSWVPIVHFDCAYVSWISRVFLFFLQVISCELPHRWRMLLYLF